MHQIAERWRVVQTGFYWVIVGGLRHSRDQTDTGHDHQCGDESNLGRGDHINSVAYVRGHDGLGLDARLVTERFGRPYYNGQIIIRADSPYQSIEDLEETIYAAPGERSWSEWMVPYLMIEEVTRQPPDEYFEETQFGYSHQEVAWGAIDGRFDCGGTFQDVRDSLAPEYAEVYDETRVIAITNDIPFVPWALRPDLEPAIAAGLRAAILAVGNSTAGKEAIGTLLGYQISGISPTDDEAYDTAREVGYTFDLDVEPCPTNEVMITVWFDGEREIEPGQTGVINGGWLACGSEYFPEFIEATSSDVTLEDSEGTVVLTLSPEKVDELWPEPETWQGTPCGDRTCLEGEFTLARWRYELTDLAPGTYVLFTTMGSYRELIDGGDCDGDGEPDVYGPDFFDRETTSTIVVH